MSERLTPEYLNEVRQRKNKYMGQWTAPPGRSPLTAIGC